MAGIKSSRLVSTSLAPKMGFYTLLLFFSVLTSVFSTGKYPFCDEHNNVGLKKVFGPLPARLGSGYVEQMRKGEPTVFCLEGSWKDFVFRYKEMKAMKGSDREVYAYHTVTYKYEDEVKVIDYLRVQIKRWQQVANAIIETNVPKDDGGLLKIKYLLDNCDCVMRIYDLNVVNVVGTAATAQCDGSDITDPKFVFIQKEVPNCERGLNPGIFKFSLLAISEVIHTRQPASSALKIQDFSIEYGTCSDRIVLGRVIPIYCYTILYKGRKVDRLLSKPYDDQTEVFRVKGYDYTEGFYIYPVTDPKQLRIKYLLDDCFCVVRIYTVQPQGFISNTFDKARCETFDQSSAGLWSAPVKAEPKLLHNEVKEEKTGCFGQH